MSSPFAKLAKLKAQMEREAQEQKPGAKPARSKEMQKAQDRERIKAVSGNATHDDTLSFARLMGGVDKLEGGKHRVPVVGPDPGAAFRETKLERFRSKEEEEAHAAHEHLRALAMGGVRFEVTDDGKHVEGRRVDLNPTLVRKLRRGQFPVDGRLDLHGKTQDESHDVLIQFLGRMRERGETMVLIIHGKGEHSHGGRGILRGEIAAWLSQGAAAHHVAAFATAGTTDGGEGATYVLLVRR